MKERGKASAGDGRESTVTKKKASWAKFRAKLSKDYAYEGPREHGETQTGQKSPYPRREFSPLTKKLCGLNKKAGKRGGSTKKPSEAKAPSAGRMGIGF